MRRLLFVGRVAFIFNLFFFVCLLIRHTHITIPVSLREFVVIQGWILSVVFNIGFGLAVIMLRGRNKQIEVPRWLVRFNLFCMLFQVVYYLFSPQ